MFTALGDIISMKLFQSTPILYFIGGREYVHATLVFNT